MQTIIAAINLLIAMCFGALRMWKTSKEDLPTVDKVKKIRDELAKILAKFNALAASTEPTWDDTLAALLSGMLETIAEAIITGLEGE